MYSEVEGVPTSSGQLHSQKYLQIAKYVKVKTVQIFFILTIFFFSFLLFFFFFEKSSSNFLGI